MFDAKQIARYVIYYSNKKGYGVSNLRLQKLLYFIQAYYLSFTDGQKECFSDKIEAWSFGPVVPDIYHEYKMFGCGNIPTPRLVYEINGGGIWSSTSQNYDADEIPKKDQKIIESVVDEFKSWSTTALVELTHNQDPWKEAYGRCKGSEIKKEAIRKYFTSP